MSIDSAAQDRRALAVFCTLAAVFCAATYAAILGGGGFEALGGYALLVLMWSPGAAGVVTALVVYRSLAPLGLTGNSRAPAWVALCVALPIAYALLIKGGLAALGLIGLASGGMPAMLLFTGLFLSLKTALGEELGWRGFASPVMTRVHGFWKGQALLGVAWYLFHVPALLGTSYGSSPHPVFGHVVFFVSCMMLSIFLGWARQQSASVWPSALFHASHNFYFLYLFEPVEPKSPLASYLTGEEGLLCALVQVTLAGIIAWGRRRGQARDGSVSAA